MTGTASTSPLRTGLGEILRRLPDLPHAVAAGAHAGASSPAWTAAVAIIVALVTLPIVAVIVLALTSSENVWPHLVATVLPPAMLNTALLALGTGTFALVVGTGAAWLVTMYRFPGRALVDRLLVIPLAMPTYIVAYCYAELFDYAGPVADRACARLSAGQACATTGFPTSARSAAPSLVIPSVLYPYVYLAARASFVQQSVCALEVARTLGRTPMGAFWSVALPLARPALAAGVALVLMETLNDLGAVQHLGVADAVRQHLFHLAAALEPRRRRAARDRHAARHRPPVRGSSAWRAAARRVHHTTGRYRAIPFQDIEGWRGYAAAGVCALPFLAGFVLPFSRARRQRAHHAASALEGGFLRLPETACCSSLVSAPWPPSPSRSLLGYARRVAANGFTRPAVRLAGLGYALPGTVLAHRHPHSAGRRSTIA